MKIFRSHFLVALSSVFLITGAAAFADPPGPGTEVLGGGGEAIAAGVGAAVVATRVDTLRERAWERALPLETATVQNARGAYNSAYAAMKRVSPGYLSMEQDYVRARDGYSYYREIDSKRQQLVQVPSKPAQAERILEDLRALETKLPRSVVENYTHSETALDQAKRNFKVKKAAFWAERAGSAEAETLISDFKKIEVASRWGYVGLGLLAADGIARLGDYMSQPSYYYGDYNPAVFPLGKYSVEAVGAGIDTMKDAFHHENHDSSSGE